MLAPPQRPKYQILTGDCRTLLKRLPDQSVNCCVTSPPYFGLRDYNVAGQIGLEQTPDAFVTELVAVFRELHRVLRDDGTLWLNLGDSYATGNKSAASNNHPSRRQKGTLQRESMIVDRSFDGLASKQLIGIPWRINVGKKAADVEDGLRIKNIALFGTKKVGLVTKPGSTGSFFSRTFRLQTAFTLSGNPSFS